MHLAKLNTGHIVQVLRYNAIVEFDESRKDWVLIMYRTKFKELKWVNTTDIVWHHEFNTTTVV